MVMVPTRALAGRIERCKDVSRCLKGITHLAHVVDDGVEELESVQVDFLVSGLRFCVQVDIIEREKE